MPTTTFYPNAHPEIVSVDGSVRHYNASGLSWADIRIAAGTNAYDSDNNDIMVGFRCDSISNKYDWLHRSIFLFDTSSLGTAIVTAATFSVYITHGSGFGAPYYAEYVNLYSASPVANTSLIATDFADVGSIAYCDTPILLEYLWDNNNQYHNWILNSVGLTAINTSGISKLSLRGSVYDVGGTAPPWFYITYGWGQFLYGDFAEGSYKPKLTITYTIITLPIVETVSATDIGQVHATLNGELTDDGGENCDCGFEWGYTVGLGNTTSTQSKATGETFSQTINVTSGHLNVYFRSFATNAAGTGYGEILSFYLPIQSTQAREVIALEAMRNIEMGCMGRLYVDEEGNLTYESRYGRNP